MSDAEQVEAPDEGEGRASPAPTGSTVWVATSRQGFMARVGAFGEHVDACDWLDEQGGEEDQLFGLVVDCPHLQPDEIAARLGVEDGAPPLADAAVERFKAPVTKGQFVEEFLAMDAEQQAQLAWRLRQNYQSLLAEIADTREILAERGIPVEDVSSTLGILGEEAMVLTALLNAR